LETGRRQPEAIALYRKNGYAVILNDRVLIYGAPSYDVTEEILKVLNAPAPEKAKN